MDGANKNLSDFDFYYRDAQFYLILSKASGFDRVTHIIAREKLHIERVLRLSLKSHLDFDSIKYFNQGILEGMKSQQATTSRRYVLELADELERRVILAKQRYSYYFTNNEA